MAASPSPQPMAVGETNANHTTGPTNALAISENQESSEKFLKPIILLHGEPTVVFDSKDLESFIREENLKYTLIAKFSHGRPELPDLRKILPQQLGFKGKCNIGLLESRHVLLRFTLKEDYIAVFSKTSRSIKFAGNVIPFRIQKWTPSFDSREETSIAMAWISFPSLPCQYFARNALLSMASAIEQPLDMDRATYDKTRPSTTGVKVEVDLLRMLPKRIRVQFKDLVTCKITNIWQKVKYDYLSYYCKICKRQGHRESDCRALIKGQFDATVNEDNIEGEKFQGDLRNHLNAKKVNLNRLEVGEKDDDGMVKELDGGAVKSGVEDQNLVRQSGENSGQLLGKVVLHDYASGNRRLSIIPQTREFSQQEKITSSPCQHIGNFTDYVGFEELLVMVSNQQMNQSKDAQLGQKIKDKRENEMTRDNSEITIKNKDTPEKLHDAILMQNADAQPENLEIDITSQSLDGQGKNAVSSDDVQFLEATDSQVELSSSNDNATENWNITTPKKSISMCINSSKSLSKSPSLEHVESNLIVQSNASKDFVCTNPFEVLNNGEKELELVGAKPTKEQTLTRVDYDNPEVAMIIQESQPAMIIKSNPTMKGMSSLSQANFTTYVIISEGKQGEMSAPRWADLVDKEEHVASPILNNKLSPKAPEFVPKSLIVEMHKLEGLGFGDSPTNAYAIDLGDDCFDEGEEDSMLDICFDKVARDGDISPRHQRSGSSKTKKKTNEDNTVGMVKSQEILFQGTFQCDWQSRIT